MSFFAHFGSYLILLRNSIRRPEKMLVYWKQLLREMTKIGVESLGIVTLISLFLGMVSTVQTAYQLVAAWIPVSIIGAVVADTTILELAPTMTCLVLAGKVGSNIASELGTMRVNEQIDALDVMGVNSAAFLIFPKVLASVIVIPLLVIIAMFLGIGGGLAVGHLTAIVPASDFIMGMRDSFLPKSFYFSLSKAYTFAFLISSISCYQGYYAKGGSIGVGKGSTRAVVWSCVLILFADYILAQIIL